MAENRYRQRGAYYKLSIQKTTQNMVCNLRCLNAKHRNWYVFCQPSRVLAHRIPRATYAIAIILRLHICPFVSWLTFHILIVFSDTTGIFGTKLCGKGGCELLFKKKSKFSLDPMTTWSLLGQFVNLKFDSVVFCCFCFSFYYRISIMLDLITTKEYGV
jgi:hypothetical protein